MYHIQVEVRIGVGQNVQYLLADDKGGLHVWLFVSAPGADAWAFTRLGLVDIIVRSVGIAVSFGMRR